MELFREEYLTIQDDYLSVDPPREESNEDDDLEYSNDDLGENTEVTPLGDAVDEDDINDYQVGPGDEDDDFDDEDGDLDIDLDEAEVDEDDDTILDISNQAIDPSEDDDFDDDDDLLDDDDDLDADISPDLEEDDDLLADDDFDEDDEDLDDDLTARTSIDTNADFASRPHGRTTGTMINHEPGLPGSGNI